MSSRRDSRDRRDRSPEHRDKERERGRERRDSRDGDRERERGHDRGASDDRYKPSSFTKQDRLERTRRDDSRDYRRDDSRERREKDRSGERERKMSRSPAPREKDSKKREKEREYSDDERDKKREKKSSKEKDKDREKEDRKKSKKSRKDDSGSEEESEEDEATKQAKALIPKITEDDYYNRSAEFAVWLTEKKKIHAGDLTSKEARKWFKKFVDKWNSFSLSSKYYKGIAPSAAPHVRTTHSWSFKNVSNDDIQRARNEVTKTTEGLDGFGNAPQPGPSEPRRRVMGPAMPGPGPAVGPSFPEDSDEEAKRIAAARQARRADRKDRDEDMEELMPRETGRDRMIEKRKMENAKRREFDSKDYDMEFGEKDLLGGGDDFKARLAARDASNARREQFKASETQKKADLNADRFSAMKAKDQATMEMLRKLAEERFGGGGGAR